jgi:predicted amidohydrolase YtcJ
MLSLIAFLASADLILTNGKIWTGDPQLRFAEAVAVRGDRIAAVGTSEQILKYRDASTRIVDLQKRLVTPGFIDNHVHFVSGGFQLSAVQLRDARSPAEFAKRLGEYAKTQPKGRWITGGDWDHELWTPAQLPTRQMIDEATPDHPVFVSRLDGHMALANSVALKLSGITRETADPPGGTIVRDPRGEPTGLLKDNAMDPVWAVVPPPTLEQRVAAARAALTEAARVGVTSLCDMSSGDAAFDDFRAYQQLLQEDALTSRIYLFVPLSSYQRLTAAGVERGFGDPRLRIGGLKGFADGSLGSSTAWFSDPYLDNPETTGLAMPSLVNGAMEKNVRGATAANLHVAIHAIGDRANDAVLRIFEVDPKVRERRYRIEHAQHLNADLIRRFAVGGVIASMQPYHAIDDGRWADRKIGKSRSAGTYAFRTLLDSGAVLTFGSDWSVAPLDPILGIYAAVTRRTIDGKNPTGWVPEQKISVEEALKCYTINNSYAMFQEHEIGRIAPGMRADLVVLSGDLFNLPPEQIETVRVDLTIVNGKVTNERD